MSEYKKCDGCGAKYKDDACHYCTSITVQENDIPKGIILLTNITPRQWSEAMEMWRNREKSDDILVLTGFDPSIETKITYFEMPGSCTCQK